MIAFNLPFRAAPLSAPRLTTADRLVNGALFLTIFLSPFVFIEPSPYEAAFALLVLAFAAARVPVDHKLVPLVLLLIAWNASGIFALLPVLHDAAAVTFTVTSSYLAVTAVVFACLLADDPVRRIRLIRTAYILAALVASVIGIAAYFHLLPGSENFLLGTIRAKSTFKDPNVFGPFLILPLLFLIERSLREGVRLTDLAFTLVLLLGLFLSFSRGAWAHFLLSAAALMVLMLLTSPSVRLRLRILALGVLAAVGLVALIAVLLSFDMIGAAFEERASLVQDYDAGPVGRFGRQLQGALGLVERPFGVGPLQFAKHFGQDPHNVYLNAIASYGWIGGIAYLALVVTTLTAGFRAVLVRTPWHPFVVALLAAFIGVAVEGFVIDTDHWRHFYLLLGSVWGLYAATELSLRRSTRERQNFAHRLAGNQAV